MSALLVLDADATAPGDEESLLTAVGEEVEAANADELTATMKLKRKPIAAKYAAAIEGLYA